MFRRQFRALTEMLQIQLCAIQEAIQEVVRANREASERAEHAQEEDEPRRIAELHAVEQETREASAYRKKSYGQQKLLNVLTFFAAGGALVAAIGAVHYAHIAAGQLEQMKTTNGLTNQALGKSDNSLKQTLAKMQAQTDATLKLYGEAKKEARAARDLAESSQAVNRPYMGAVAFEPPTYDEKNGLAEVAILQKNFGPVPAMDIVAKVRGFTNGLEVQLCKGGVPLSPAVLLPGDAERYVINFCGMYARQVPTAGNQFTLCVSYTYTDPRGKNSYTATHGFNWGLTWPETEPPTWTDIGECPTNWR